MQRFLAILLAAALASPLASAQGGRVKSLSSPIVIGHRGASGERPEHTLASYEVAIADGADFIEPDLVLTKDNVFVARHENDITGTTDVANHPEFASRKTTKTIDGEKHTGWFTEDFTLAELKTLRAKERLPQLRPANAAYDGKYTIPTLAEIIALAKKRSKELGRTIGIYPETKHPTYFASIGLPMERHLVAELKAAGWDSATAPVFIQSFEVNNLKFLHTITKIRLIQLMDGSGGPADNATPSYASMITPVGLKAVSAYAWGIGPNKDMVDKGEGTPTTLVADAHKARLRVHVWTFRAENFFLPASLRVGANPLDHGNVAEAMRRQLALGIDGFFTDFPLIGATARNAYRATPKK
ncbi:MAG: glycerophosphodiester phosphodiesterase [Sphingomonas sp.]|uniref:glycerophosphodiester phosphodiesterase n=1 Tax=Sphingomonas sp. TaxID=28214 RepID=UPI00121E11DC|nr:glycerophosphodiester phosphodiesterase [Sphingomonas sp.]THD34545.1 MAG: glycerophosphodiester phosphodiesterase [Sphingomonas sp.]